MSAPASSLIPQQEPFLETDLAFDAHTPAIDSGRSSVRSPQPVGTIISLAVSDVLAIVSSLMAAAALRNVLLSSSALPSLRTLLAALVLVLCSLMAAGLYPGVTINPVEELRRSSLSIGVAFLGLLAATFLLHDLSQSRLIYVFACLFTGLLVPLFRAGTRGFFCGCAWWGSPVAILGFGTTGKRVFETLTRNPRIGLRPIAVLDDNPDQFAEADPRLSRGPLSRCRSITHERHIPYGIVCMPALSREDLLGRIDQFGMCFGHVLVIPNLIGMTCLGISAREVGGIVGLEVKHQLLRPSAQFVKRFLDLAITIAVAPLVLLLVAICAVLIKLEGKGPVLFKNERVGYGGKKFTAWKLRSMVPNSEGVLRDCLANSPELETEWASTQKLKRDPRLTRVGRIIRKTSIDELPQFWNVLAGEMSVVGPRPILQKQIALYGSSFNLYRKVRPGITGLWQVSGRNHLSFAERVKLDRYVIQNWSVWLDLYILARTAAVVLTTRGAY